MKPNEARFEAEFRSGSLTTRLFLRVIVVLASLVSQEFVFICGAFSHSTLAVVGKSVFVMQFPKSPECFALGARSTYLPLFAETISISEKSFPSYRG